MESLKPLKIIGGLALLCLIVYLAIPNGRLNTMAALRNLGFPKYTASNMFQGKYAEFLELNQDLEIDLGGANVQQQQIRRERYLNIALDLNDPAIIGIASRKATVYSTSKDRNPGEENRFQTLLALSEKVNLAGQKLEPENAFFPLQLATIADSRFDMPQVSAYLAQAAECETYSDYGWEEAQISIDALAYTPSQVERANRLASVMFKNLGSQKATVRRLIGPVEPEKNIQDRLNAIKVGRIMAASKATVIAQLVGRSFVNVGLSKLNPEDYSRPQPYPANQLEAIAKSQHIETNGLFENAARFAKAQVDTSPFIENGNWELAYSLGPFVSGLPPAIFLLFTTLVTLLLLTQKIAERPWIKPIRYLALVPLSLCLAQNPESYTFHLPTVITILCVSLPIALITMTEKFVPVIHLTIVAISLYFFERSTVLSEVLFHVSLMAALVLFAWHKNRKPETKFSRFLSIALVFATLGIMLMWTPAALSGQWGIASLPMVLACVCFSTLAIVDADRQQARRQATTAACIGFAALAATMLVSLKTSDEIQTMSQNEVNLVKRQSLLFDSYFTDPQPANNSAPDNVKK